MYFFFSCFRKDWKVPQEKPVFLEMIDDSCTYSYNTHDRKMGEMRPLIRYQIRTECNVYKWGHCNSVPSILCCVFSSDLQILVLTTPSISHTCLDTMYFQYPLFKFFGQRTSHENCLHKTARFLQKRDRNPWRKCWLSFSFCN